MQNVVDVACSSPPVAMNATKPAAQAVQATDQDPFGLVLQKASEKIVNNKQSDNASKSSESKFIENKHGSDNTANEKVKEPKNESEVVKASKTDKSESSEKTAKSEEADDKLINTKNDKVTESDPMVYGYVPSPTTVEVVTSQAVEQSVDTTSDVVTVTVQPANILQTASSSPVKSETEDAATSISENQVALTSTEESADAPIATSGKGSDAVKVDGETITSFSQTLTKGAKVEEKTTTELKPVISSTNEKSDDVGKVSVSTSTNNQGESVINISRINKETVSPTPVTSEKVTTTTEVETSQQTAPPDNPNGATVTAANAVGTVQTTTQISEPARLAEAPKNEVITQVANQIDQMVKSNRSSVRMQLYPEELGHIDLRIVTTKDGIGVTMVTDKASAQQALKSEMDSLRQSIEQAGIQLTNLNINQGHNSNRQQSFEHRQNFSNGSYSGNGSDNSNSSSNEPKKHLTSSVVDYKV